MKILSTILAFGLMSCGGAVKNKTNTEAFVRTVETENLIKNLKAMPKHGVMFGHHDDPLYGIGWNLDEGRSDVKSLVGDYPAVMSFDLGHIEHGRAYSLDSVPFERIREEIIAQYKRGGMNTVSWHLDNPLTGGDSWDVSDSTVVVSVLPGGVNHEKMLKWIDRLGDFMSSLTTEEGVKVPVLFRPWHEHTGSWFWWGQDLCSDQEYIALWQMTYNRLKENKVDNLLFAYSPGSEPNTVEEYLKRYPGEEMVDLIGFDCYRYDQSYAARMPKMMNIITDIAHMQDVATAITETGYEAIPDAQWWTETLLPILQEYPTSYVLVWRNARERENHYYAPYPGQVSAGNFVQFYDNPLTLFAKDAAGINLYR